MNPSSAPQASPYPRFFLMLAVSFGVMYGVMYLNTYEPNHVYFSLMRFYMTWLMVLPMALIMLGFMGHMYQHKTTNRLIVLGSVALFAGVLALMRTQTFIDEVTWMKGMIPHHSIAILTSERATIRDPEARQLADDIIATQQREIAEMQAMLERLGQ